MSPGELRALGLRVYDAINAQDLDTLERLFAPDIVRHAMGEVGIEPALAAVRTAAGVRFEVEDVFAAEPDRVALRVTVHRADAAPMTILEIFRVADSHVAEIWGAAAPTRPGPRLDDLAGGHAVGAQARERTSPDPL